MSKFKNCFAFDLGKSHFRIFEKGRLALEVPTEIEYEGNIINNLIRQGVIADFYACEILIRENIKKLQKPIFGIFSESINAIIAVPDNNSDVSLRACRDLMEHAGSRLTYMINNSFVAGIGLGLNIKNSTYTIVDFGAGKTSISTVENKKIIKTETLDISSEYLIEQLQNFIRQQYGVEISKKHSEQLMIEHTSLYNTINSNRTIRIEGIENESNKNVTISIENAEINNCLNYDITYLIERINRHVNNLNKETKTETLKNGINIIGKGSKLNGFKELISEKTKISTASYSSPESYMTKGLEIILRNPDLYSEFMIN